MHNFYTSIETRAKRNGCLLGLVLVLVLGTFVMLLIPRAWMTVSDVTTGATPEYPDLKPRRYDMSPNQTLDLAAAVIGKLPSWKVVRRDTETRTLEATVKVSIGLFTDDVTVTVRPVVVGDGKTTSPSSEVVVRSRSRLGRGDLGENARHIRVLQAAMDERLPSLI